MSKRRRRQEGREIIVHEAKMRHRDHTVIKESEKGGTGR